MVLEHLDNKLKFEEFVNKPGVNLVHFSAAWASACGQLNSILNELQAETNDLNVATIDAESVSDVSLEYGITSSPTVHGREIDKLTGFHPTEIKNAIIKHSFSDVPVKDNEPDFEDFKSRLKRLINHSRLTLFMKGTTDAPRCGFSKQIVDILKSVNADFWSFDILEDDEVRQGLKVYSDWPTYPQLYLDGELLGGLDIVREEMRAPEFVNKLPKLK